MFITNEDYAKIASALLTADADRKEVKDALEVMKRLQEKKAMDNKRISSYIADKRKIDKNYARSKKKEC